MVVKDGVDGAVLSFPIELDIILSRGVDGKVSSSWNARSNALSIQIKFLSRNCLIFIRCIYARILYYSKGLSLKLALLNLPKNVNLCSPVEFPSFKNFRSNIVFSPNVPEEVSCVSEFAIDVNWNKT